MGHALWGPGDPGPVDCEASKRDRHRWGLEQVHPQRGVRTRSPCYGWRLEGSAAAVGHKLSPTLKSSPSRKRRNAEGLSTSTVPPGLAKKQYSLSRPLLAP